MSEVPIGGDRPCLRPCTACTRVPRSQEIALPLGPPRTIGIDLLQSPMGRRFLMSEVALKSENDLSRHPRSETALVGVHTWRLYRGTSLMRNCAPVGPYRRPTPRALWWSEGGSVFSWARYVCTVSDAGLSQPSRGGA
jgi:hypothetical protein